MDLDPRLRFSSRCAGRQRRTTVLTPDGPPAKTPEDVPRTYFPS